MDEELESLRQQRELIRRHLDWLEARIRRAETQAGPEAPFPPTGAGHAPTEASAPTAPAPSSPSEASPAAEPPSPREPAPAPAASRPEIPEPVLPEPNPRGDIARAKIGCVVLFVLSCLLFLFLLFGLPYLL